MRKRIPLLLALVLAAALFSGCALILPNYGPPDPPQQQEEATDVLSETLATPPPVSVTVTPDTYAYTSDYINASLDLPVVAGLSDAEARRRINDVFLDYGKKIKDNIPVLERESKKLMESGAGIGVPYEVLVSYSVNYNKNGLLNVTLSNYAYTGGAHGGEIRLSLLFDLATGDRLYLDDLMKEGGEYRRLISDLIRKEIEERVSTGELYELVAFEDIGQSPNFYLTDEAIVFYFQEYEYFPYAAGIQEFPIPYSALTDVLNNKYPLQSA